MEKMPKKCLTIFPIPYIINSAADKGSGQMNLMGYSQTVRQRTLTPLLQAILPYLEALTCDTYRAFGRDYVFI